MNINEYHIFIDSLWEDQMISIASDDVRGRYAYEWLIDFLIKMDIEYDV